MRYRPGESRVVKEGRLKPNGEQIRQRRIRMGLDQETFARRAGIDAKTLRRIEANQTDHPQTGTIRAIAGVLGCTPEDLFTVVPSAAPSRDPVSASPSVSTPPLESLGIECPSCRSSESDPEARFCRRCGVTLETGRRGGRRQVTVLCVLIRNLVEIGERTGEEGVQLLLDRLVERVRVAAQHFEGAIELAATGAVAVFGVPVVHEDHCARSCRAALSLVPELRTLLGETHASLGVELDIGLGLHSGRTVARRSGPSGGWVVGLASQLALAAEPLEILASSAAREACGGGFRFEARAGRFPVESEDHHALVGAGSSPPAGARPLSPFVGRQRALTIMEAAFHEVLPNRGRVLCVVGDPGIGKSRICSEFLEIVRQEDVRVLSVRCPSHGRRVPLLSVRDLAIGLLELGPGLGRKETYDRIRSASQKLEGERSDGVEVLLELLEGARDDRSSSEPDPLRLDLAFELLRELIRLRVERERLVIFIEDVHWMDSASRDFLADLVAVVQSTGLLVMLNFRSEYLPDWMTSPSVDRIVLRPLTTADTRTLVLACIGDQDLPSSVVDRICERAGGNPFFAEEIVQFLVERGLVRGGDGPPELLSADGLPPRVEDMIAARIDRLASDRRSVLEAAAVIGVAFSEPLLRSMTHLPELDLRTVLTDLQWLEFIEELPSKEGRRFQFRHALLQEVTYRSLLREARLRLHDRALDIVRQLPAKPAEKVDALAFHAEGAERWSEAATYLAAAASLALQKAALAASVDYYERAIGALDRTAEDPSSPRAAELRLRYVQALTMSGDADRAAGVLREIDPHASDPGKLALLHVNHVHTCWVRGRYQESLEHCEEAERCCARGVDGRVGFAVEFGFARAHFGLGNMSQSARYLERALEHLTSEGLDEAKLGWPGIPSVLARAFMAHSLAEIGELDEARKRGEEALALATRLRDPYGEVNARLGLGHVFLVAHELEAALEVLWPAERACREVGMGSLAVAVVAQLAHGLVATGRLEDARRRLQGAGRPRWIPELTRLRLVRAQGRLDHHTGASEQARWRLDKARRAAAAQHDRCSEAYALYWLAQVESATRPEHAAAALNRALALTLEVGLRPLMARCHVARGSLVAPQNRGDALREWQKAHDLFDALALRSEREDVRAHLGSL